MGVPTFDVVPSTMPTNTCETFICPEYYACDNYLTHYSRQCYPCQDFCEPDRAILFSDIFVCSEHCQEYIRDKMHKYSLTSDVTIEPAEMDNVDIVTRLVTLLVAAFLFALFAAAMYTCYDKKIWRKVINRFRASSQEENGYDEQALAESLDETNPFSMEISEDNTDTSGFLLDESPAEGTMYSLSGFNNVVLEPAQPKTSDTDTIII